MYLLSKKKPLVSSVDFLLKDYEEASFKKWEKESNKKEEASLRTLCCVLAVMVYMDN